MRLSLCKSAVLASLIAAPAHAQIAPEPLWQDWVAAAEEAGLTVSIDSRQMDAGTLTLRSVRLEGDDGTAVTLPVLRLADDGAATQVTLPAGETIRVEVPRDGGYDARVELGGDGLRLRATGSLEATNYALTNGDLDLTLAELTGPDGAIDADAALAIAGLGGEVTGVGTGEGQAQLGADTLSLTAAAPDPDSDARMELSAEQTELAITGRLAEDDEDGRRLRAEVAAETGSLTQVQTQGDAGRIEASIDHGPSTTGAILSSDRLETDTNLAALSITVDGPALPGGGPIAVDIAEMAMTSSQPLTAAPEPQPAPFELSLTDVMPTDAVWDRIDPDGALPREPAQLTATGVMRVAVTEADGAAERVARALELDTFRLNYGDAALEAEGTMAAEPIPGTTMPDPSRMEGEMAITATGAAGLLNQLVSAGIVSQSQAMGVQMMVAMFAQTGDDDTITTTIEARPDGSLFVGGTQLR